MSESADLCFAAVSMHFAATNLVLWEAMFAAAKSTWQLLRCLFVSAAARLMSTFAVTKAASRVKAWSAAFAIANVCA